MLECFRFNFEMSKILLYKVYMLKYREGVCHFVKTLKRWLFFTLILSILPPPIPKKKKKMPECLEETFLIWKFKTGKGISFAYFSTLNLLLQFSIINVIRIKKWIKPSNSQKYHRNRGFRHHHYIMTNLFKCFNFHWQMPPEKLSCIHVL